MSVGQKKESLQFGHAYWQAACFPVLPEGNDGWVCSMCSRVLTASHVIAVAIAASKHSGNVGHVVDSLGCDNRSLIWSMSLRPLWRSLGPAVRPGRVSAVLPRLGAVRAFADRKTGTVKLWNDQKGFGFITPSEGGEDVFVHRTGIAEGVTLSPGLSVSFAPEWDDKKRKDRASDVQLEAGGEGSTLPASDQQGSKVADSHHIVGSWEKWSIHKKAMAGEDSVFRQQVTIRDDAPKVGELRREEFQIVGNASWDIRLYPGGGDKQDKKL